MTENIEIFTAYLDRVQTVIAPSMAPYGLILMIVMAFLLYSEPKSKKFETIAFVLFIIGFLIILPLWFRIGLDSFTPSKETVIYISRSY